MTGLKAWVRALEFTKGAGGSTLPGLMESLAHTFGDHPALLMEGDSLTYKGLSDHINRISRWAIAQGLGSGDVVGLLMLNRIDYIAVWLGLSRIGCTVALLNSNLRGEALLHCISVAQANMLIIADVGLDQRPPVGRLVDWDAARPAVDQFDGNSIPDLDFPDPNDRALLIYSSGTTGLPKAINITHRRIIEWSFWFAGMMDTRQSDRLYDCLPMYHSVGGVVAVGSMLVKGGSVFIRQRFSASQFWDDVADNECTIFQYIGELCRYLTLSESHPKERRHRLRLACGNGMQRSVWQVFQDRFAVPQILEFYAATEGNLSLYNVEGKPGTIGRIPPFLAQHFSVAIIRCDPETGIPVLGADGFCVRCVNDEPGEAISQMGHGRVFEGYTDAEASRRKILRNVFVEGDSWFRSGDLMRKDAAGYYYFVDRLGDTFRWKGENVSTTEVATVVRRATGVMDAVVYGVTVAGEEGRAGMAAISTNAQFSFPAFSAHLKEHLPNYAQPVFVRLCASLDMTGTFKLTKTDLIREGHRDLADPVWRRDPRTGEYHRMSSSSGGHSIAD